MPYASHTALLLPDVEKAAAVLKQLGFEPGAPEIFDGEGTKEIYVGFGQGNALLLMEPTRDGSYRRALLKRGPGLHHLGVDVLKLEPLLEALQKAGWSLHPNTEKTMAKTRTAYLTKPGFPMILEIQERKEIFVDPPFLTEVELPLPAGYEALLAPLGGQGQQGTHVLKKGTELKLSFGSRSVLFKHLL